MSEYLHPSEVGFVACQKKLLAAAGIRYGHTLKPSKANTRKKRLKKQRRILKSIDLWHESEMAYLRSRCEGKIYSQDTTIRFQNCEITKLPMLVMESEGRSIVSVLQCTSSVIGSPIRPLTPESIARITQIQPT